MELIETPLNPPLRGEGRARGEGVGWRGMWNKLCCQLGGGSEALTRIDFIFQSNLQKRVASTGLGKNEPIYVLEWVNLLWCNGKQLTYLKVLSRYNKFQKAQVVGKTCKVEGRKNNVIVSLCAYMCKF